MRRCHDVPPYREEGKLCSLAAPDHASAANHSFLAVGGVSADPCINWHMYYNVCRVGIRNPQRGAVNFDNIGYAWLTTFQVRGQIGLGPTLFCSTPPYLIVVVGDSRSTGNAVVHII